MTDSTDSINDDSVIALFDKESIAWDERYQNPYYEYRLFVYRKWLGRHLREAHSGPSKRALDIGCATFPASDVFSKYNVDAVGIDVSPRMVDRAKSLKRNAVLYNGFELPFEDHGFSIITMINVFEYVRQPMDLFKEIRRVATPDVKILMTINNHKSLIKKLARIFMGRSFGTLKEWHSSYTISSLATIIQPLGFTAPVVYEYSFPTLYERAPLLLQSSIFRNKCFADNIFLEIQLKP